MSPSRSRARESIYREKGSPDPGSPAWLHTYILRRHPETQEPHQMASQIGHQEWDTGWDYVGLRVLVQRGQRVYTGCGVLGGL